MSNKNPLATTDDKPAPLTTTANIAGLPETPGFEDPEVREINAVDSDHHAVQEIGESALRSEAGRGAGKFLSEYIYEHNSAWPREWLQNEEAACIRKARFLVKMSDEYPEGWLTNELWIDRNGETVIDYDEEYDAEKVAEHHARPIEIPRPVDEVLEAARSLGYDPTIVWDVFMDERQIVTVDNGDGMTPTQFEEDFNDVFQSGSEEDGDTGGMFGVGSESSAIVHGDEGGMTGQTRSILPDENGNRRKGFHFYSYLGGGNILPGEVEDGFFGTRFEIPVEKDFNLDKLQGWVEDYTEQLRVPVLYREHTAGTTPVEEEYGGVNFIDSFDDPPVTIHRPGEWSAVAGPDVIETGYHADDEDTFLVSMPIDRNTRASISTFWDVVIQLHDEQGRIVAGPNRGKYRENLEELHEDDAPMPQPVGSRDQLSRDDVNKRFFYHVQDMIKEEELKNVAEIAERMKQASHPGKAILGEGSDWTLFKKMVQYHGSRNIGDRRHRFMDFLADRDEFPDFSDKRAMAIYNLFTEVEHCHKGPGRSSKKKRRSETPLGEILAETDPTEVYMAASTGGNFTQRFKVIRHNNSNAEVIVVGSAAKYDKWGSTFGFKVLKEVPLTKDDEHDFDIPDAIHKDNINKRSNTGKAEEVKNRALKIRNDGKNASIDSRLTIEAAQSRLEGDGTFGNGRSKLVLFPQGQEYENISDHYDLADYAAIASVSGPEFDELAHYDDVLTYEEFTEWSRSALIATEDGAMTPEELVNDDRMVVLAYRPQPYEKDVVQLLGDDYEELRTLYKNDIRDQYSWHHNSNYDVDRYSEPPESEKFDALFAVTDAYVLNRAEWAFDQLDFAGRHITGLKLTRQKYGRRNPCKWKSLSGSTATYRLMADTPNWDNDSDVYDMVPKDRDKPYAQLLLGFHDRGIDPSEKEPSELREFVY